MTDNTTETSALPGVVDRWRASGPAQSLFNSTVAASALAALDELGFMDRLEAQGEVSLAEFCDEGALHSMTFRALLHAVACFDIVIVDDGGDTARPGAGFADAVSHKGYFLWLIRGYGGMMRELGAVAREPERTGRFIDRDGEWIAVAGKDYGRRFVDADFARVIAREPFTSAADLGCGSAERLIRLAKERPDFRGVGVEFDEGAVWHSRKRVESLGLGDRITLLHGDVSKLTRETPFEGVDVLFSFFMAHDLWPREHCVAALNGVAHAFPHAGRFLLCDTYRSDMQPSADVPIFTLGFEVTHAAMGQRVPSREEWLDLFEDTVWTLSAEHPIGIPFSTIFELKRDLD